MRAGGLPTCGYIAAQPGWARACGIPQGEEGERFARLFRMYSHKRERLDAVGPGDIVAAAGMKEAVTGDTLCDRKEQIAFESIRAPQPVISVAIEPRDATGSKKLGETLSKLQAEDPTFQVRVDSESGQTVMSGMGELHLEVLTRRIDEDFGVDVRVGAPRVVYRETLAREATAESTFDRELAGEPQFARVRVGVAPRPGGGVSCESAVDDPRLFRENLDCRRSGIAPGIHVERRHGGL